MGKKDNKGNASGEGGGKNGKGVNLAGISNVPNRDIMQRMNFLWQASVLLEGLGGSSGLRDDVAGTGTSGGGDEMRGSRGKKGLEMKIEKRKSRAKKVNTSDLARMYVRTMNIVGQRTTTKMDPSVKRTLCRGCSSVLIPGISARIRSRPSRQHEHWVVYTCLKCNTSRRIPAPRNEAVASPHPSGPGPGVGATTTRNIHASMETRVAEEQQRSVQTPSSPHSRPARQQQSQDHSEGKEHSEEHVGDKQDSKMDVQINVLGDQPDHANRNIIVPHEEGTKSLAKQKKTRKKKKKKKLSTVPAPREPPLFARKNAGHVVYRGGEAIDMEGVYCV